MNIPKFLKVTGIGIIVVLLLSAYSYYLLNKETRRLNSNHVYNYYVWEIDVLSAKDHQGEVLQIAEIRGPNLNNIDLPSERQFADQSWEEQKTYAITNLGNSPASMEDLTSEVGTVNKTQTAYLLTLNSLFEGPELQIQPAQDESEATFTLKLVKRCDVKLSIVEKTNWKRRTQGMWTLPYKYTRDVLEITKPDCYDPNDQQVIIKKP